MDILSSAFGEFQLSRFPRRRKDQLRAWDAADEYILQHLSENEAINEHSKVLIVNDQFGALAVSLNQFHPESISDSWLAHAGTKENQTDNQISQEDITLHTSLNYPKQIFDIVLIKVPKSLAMLEDQLIRLKPLLTRESTIIAGAMTKAIHTSTLKLFEKIIGPTKTSLAKKKARLIFPTIDESLNITDSPYPSTYKLEGTQYQISNHAAVFSRDSLDIGTRFFLQYLPATDKYETIVDLGCGNGVVGLVAAEKNPKAVINFVDESFMAVDSAKINFIHAFGPERTAIFTPTDCLQGLAKNSFDLVLNNPPFHQQNVVGDFIAQQMFHESYAVLKKGGELWVIGNRHLGYHISLKKIFGNCITVASNKKFIILRATK
ncbi:methyltransferase [Neptuniibacter marinus]|uniref:methyltransferase n=1 Tax=Neptuniibacter marinus TaxID=1806670 RepID=UPI0008366C8C|nr:methyltransferase [Neptuniibacter marinus]